MLEGYITPLLMSYIDRYVKNIKPSDLQLSFWGGDAVLRNLELKLEVLERELSIPLDFKSGKIRELVLHIPWNAIVSTSVEITIRDMEFVVKLKDVRTSTQSTDSTDSAAAKEPIAETKPTATTDTNEQTPGYLQSYLSRISNNVSVHIQNLVVKVIEEECDMMLTLNIGAMEYYTTDESWNKKFIYTDYLQENYSINKVVEVKDMAVNLHAIEEAGTNTIGSHDPFVQRCSFMVRLRSEYRGKTRLKKTVNVLFESISFSVDERQFCLYLHLMDWLLAMYYSSKRLKGRDDHFTTTTPQPMETQQQQQHTDTSPDNTDVKGQSTGSSGDGQSVPVDSQGWGSWFMSFVGGAEEGTENSSSSSSKSSEFEKTLPSSTFAIFAKSVTVTLRMTHQMQVPMFYSVQSFTTPVIQVSFTSCMAQLDKVPQTNLFLFSIGINNVDANIMGLCPCVKKLPSSWRRASASNITDRTEQVTVFSMGSFTATKDTGLSEAFLKQSLFDPQCDSTTIELPPLSESELIKLGSPYSAVWFTYLYFDVGTSRHIEECTEQLLVGEIRASFSPDVIHRLQHFITAYHKSTEANPSFSKGMVVIGDPKAETIFKIKLNGGFISFTPNTHYLAQSVSGTQLTPKMKKRTSQDKSIFVLRATCSDVDVHVTQPMYRGNATVDLPQKFHLQATLRDVQLGFITIQCLSDCIKPAAATAVLSVTGGAISSFNQFMSLPYLEVNQHSRTHDEPAFDDSYLQVDSNEVSISLSLLQISKLLFIGGSWKNESPLTPPTFNNVSCFGHVHVSIADINITKSYKNNFNSISLIVGELRGAIVTESDSNKLGQLIPVIYGPLNTDEWMYIETYRECKSSTKSSGKLFELLITTPIKDLTDKAFSTVQLSIAGCGVCMEPALMEFIRHLPLDVMATKNTDTPTSSGNQPLAPPTLSFAGQTVTPSQVTEPVDETEKNRKDLFSLLKTYVTKVDIKPLLLVVPWNRGERSSSSVVSPSKVQLNPDFPILFHLTSSTSDHTPSLILCLPFISIVSTRSSILDEPVPMEGSKDTFPWDCTFDGLSVLTIIRGTPHYLLQPLTVNTTLASQQVGTAVTIHIDSIILSISKKQLSLVNDVITDFILTSRSLSTSCLPNMEVKDSGVILSESVEAKRDAYPSSIVSSQSYSTVTPINAQTTSEISTASSNMFQGFSTLWVQLLISKLSFTIYSREYCELTTGESLHGSSYTTPLTSPCTLNSNSPTASDVNPVIKLSTDIDGVSLQVDVQERCTDVIFKLSSVECSYLKSFDIDSWKPYLPSSNGKLFSTSTSLLPQEMRPPLMFGGPLNYSVSSPQHSKLQPNFIHITIKLPRGQLLHRRTDISVQVSPFELVAWLPLTQLVRDIFPETKYSTENVSSGKTESSSLDTYAWPRIELSMECFGIIFPSSDYTSALVISSGGVQLTSSLEYVGTDVRFITNHTAFKQLSKDKGISPLPAYQLEVLSLNVSGITRNNTLVRTLLYASTSQVKMIYTPPLYSSYQHTTPPSSTLSSSLIQLQTPTTIKHHSSFVQATGHSFEANFTTNVIVFIGAEQVDCICSVLKTNMVTLSAKDSANEDSSMISSSKPSNTTPCKLLVTGSLLTIFLLTVDTVSEVFVSMATPIVQSVVYNPLLSYQSTDKDNKMETSCFNMAISYTHQPNAIAYSDLIETQVSDIMKYQLLETKRGQLSDKNSLLPANLISMSWSTNKTDIESGNSAGVLAIDIGRPVKLTVCPFIIQELNKLINHLTMNTQRLPEQLPTTVEENDNSSLYFTPQKESKLLNETNSVSIEFTLAMSQLLIELQLASDDPGDETDLLPAVSQETEVFLHGDGSPSCKEAVLLSWDELVFTVPATTTSCHVADLLISGLQLVAIFENESNCFIIPPVQLSCLLTHHLPASTYDRSNIIMKFSCGLIELHVSQKSVELLTKIIQSFSVALHDTHQQLMTSQPLAEPVEKSADEQERQHQPVSFADDLRMGDFKYVINDELQDVPPQKPAPGEIFFHNGGVETPPTMMWHYGEPRAVTRLHILPVPFNITSEEDVPVDIKMECTLEYWNEIKQIFIKLAHFYISEVSNAEWSLPVSVALPTVASRIWRICLNHLEWVDEEDVEIFALNKEDASDEAMSLSSVVSPLSLAASTKIDSIFSLEFIPSISLSCLCHELELVIFHQCPPSTNSCFNSYHVVSSSVDSQELFRIKATDINCHFNHTMYSSITNVQVGGSISLDYVDFRYLVWSSAIYPTNVQLDVNYQHTNKLPELSVNLKCSPAVIRISQGLVHTTTLTISVWKMTRDDEGKVKGQPHLLNHYILCNDTLEDLHIGQMSTDEDVLLPSNSCFGYSWRTHKNSPEELRVCLVVDGIWKWSKPFSLDSNGVYNIELLITVNQPAILYVKIDDIGGVQKQVTFFGSWKLFSSLHFPLEIQLCSTSEQHQPLSVPTGTPSFHFKCFTLPAQAALPSILATDNQLCGLRMRLSKELSWSKMYPLGTSTHEWTKPQLLAELESGSSEMVHYWYSIKSMDSTTVKHWGNKITLSPLFQLTNHLPFNLKMIVSDTQSLSALPGELHSQLTSTDQLADSSQIKIPGLLPGNGQTVPLYSFNADMWYNIKLSCVETTTAFSEPSLALSTFLLQHLPVSNKHDNIKPATAYLSLPLDNSFTCCVHTALLRTSLNTINVELRSEAMVINKCCGLTVQLVERLTVKEQLSEGVLIADKQDRVTILKPFSAAVMVQKQFVLRVDQQSCLFNSELISLPVLMSSEERSKSKQNALKSSTVVSLKPQGDLPNSLLGQLLLSFTSHHQSLTAIIKPPFILHNATNHTLSIWPCVVNKAESALFSDTPPHSDEVGVVLQVSPGESVPVIFWQEIARGVSKYNTLCMRVITNEDDVIMTSWSINLSLNFVRRLFSLPVGCGFIPCLLTTHELDDITYLVVSHDPCPQIRIQNLCPTDFEIVEIQGTPRCPQVIPAGHEVFYEPPSLAKLYPIVYDDDVASERDKKLFKSAQNVELRLRASISTNKHTHVISPLNFNEWSGSFSLTSDQDKQLAIPQVGDVLISIDRQSQGLFISLLPTGGSRAVHQLVCENTTISSTEKPSYDMRFNCRLKQLVISLCDEVTTLSCINEVLRIISDETELHYSLSSQEGTKIDFNIQSLRVDNMTEKSTAEFAVTFLPRVEHAARPKLVKEEPLPLLKLQVHFHPHIKNSIESLYVSLQPITVQLEDNLLHKLRKLVSTFSPPGVLRANISQTDTSLIVIPTQVLQEAEMDVYPLVITNLVLESTAVYLKASVTLKAFLSCNDTPFKFARYELNNVHSSWSDVSQVIAARYISTTFMHIGWLLGSLELIGSPGTFIQSIGRGLRDLVSLPYEGITRSPSLFILGIGRGTASFFRECSTGALTSITNLASSISRNMDRLSMDTEHISYQDQHRKEQPAGLTSGVSSFGFSLMSAVAGIVEQPMQSVQSMDTSSSTLATTRSILTGVGKGLIGVVAKPVGGAMELVSQTGQGLMQGTGLTSKLVHKSLDDSMKEFVGMVTRCNLLTAFKNCTRHLGINDCIAVTTASLTDGPTMRRSVLLFLTTAKLFVVDSETNSVQLTFPIKDYIIIERADDNAIDETDLQFVVCSTHQQCTNNYESVERYLQLSEMIAATVEDNKEEVHQQQVILHIERYHATQLVCVYHNIRRSISDSDDRFLCIL